MTEQVKTAEEVLAAIRAAFDAGKVEGKDDDAIKMDMISAGATFKNVTRAFNEFMIEGGFAASKEERDQKVVESVQGVDIATEEGFNAAVAKLVESLTGTTDKSAASLIRALAKKHEIPCFKKTKEATGESKQGFAGKFYEFLAANPTATKEQAVAFIQGTNGNEETSENVKRHESHYLAIHRLVNRIAGVAA